MESREDFKSEDDYQNYLQTQSLQNLESKQERQILVKIRKKYKDFLKNDIN